MGDVIRVGISDKKNSLTGIVQSSDNNSARVLSGYSSGITYPMTYSGSDVISVIDDVVLKPAANIGVSVASAAENTVDGACAAARKGIHEGYNAAARVMNSDFVQNLEKSFCLSVLKTLSVFVRRPYVFNEWVFDKVDELQHSMSHSNSGETGKLLGYSLIPGAIGGVVLIGSLMGLDNLASNLKNYILDLNP